MATSYSCFTTRDILTESTIMTCSLSLKACPLKSLTLSFNMGFKWNHLTDNMLKAVAHFWLVIAITSQLMLGYFAANYYDHEGISINQGATADRLIRIHAIESNIIKIIYQ
jgi:hypothetical protein